MAAATVVHGSSPLSLVGLLIDDEAVRCHDCTNLVLFLLTTDAEDFVVHLDRCEVFWECLWVAQTYLSRRLRCELVNHQRVVRFIVVV